VSQLSDHWKLHTISLYSTTTLRCTKNRWNYHADCAQWILFFRFLILYCVAELCTGRKFSWSESIVTHWRREIFTYFASKLFWGFNILRDFLVSLFRSSRLFLRGSSSSLNVDVSAWRLLEVRTGIEGLVESMLDSLMLRKM
jgi:hypothetical protein